MIKTYTINTQKAISETLDNETIIINLETGCYYSMNSAGTTLWQAIAESKSFDSEKLDPSLSFFIKTLQEEGLIHEAETTSDSFANLETIHDPKIDKYTDMQEMLLADPVHDVDTAGWPNLKKE